MHKILRFGLKNIVFSRTVNPFLDKPSSTLINCQVSANPHTCYQTRNSSQKASPLHLICLKDWNAEMVSTVLYTALNLKQQCQDTHGKKLNLLPEAKVMILEDHCNPICRMAASKATSLLGADDVHIVSKISWDQHYYGKIYSEMADVILVSTETYGCIRRFINHSTVPVICMQSRKHANIQSLATVMSIIEDYGTLQSLNLAYVGSPNQVLNDYLILCPLLGAHFKFKCSCSQCPVSPLLFQDCKDLCKKLDTSVEQVTSTPKALWNVTVVIAGPTTKKPDKLPEFILSAKEIQRNTNWQWTFYHTCPRGKEVDDELFLHNNARTYNAFKNMQYIAAALIILSLKCSQCYPAQYQCYQCGCVMG